MSKSLLELYEQAASFAYENCDRTKHPSAWEGVCTGKFGDLIVQECIKIVQETPKHCAYTTYDLNVVQCTIDKSVDLLKSKFGL